MILAGDLGGTKANLGLFDVQEGKLVRLADKRYATRDHAGLEEIASDFLNGSRSKITAASFGIAGPVVDNRVQATNFPWLIDGGRLAKHLHLDRVHLVNDVEAAAYGIGVLEPNELETIHAGVPALRSTQIVISAGTGLGEGVLFWDGQRHAPMATEAGHADFAPNTEQQADLWKFLKARNEFVSTEIILSGGGFQRLHEFLNPSLKHPGFDTGAPDPAPEITRMGLSGECSTCSATLDLWVQIYGSEAGNLALRTVARGGIYVAGGIAVKVLPRIRTGIFAAAVRHKEKLETFLSNIPIHVVLNEECPLLGAAFVAWQNI
jgi:glucokinase